MAFRNPQIDEKRMTEKTHLCPGKEYDSLSNSELSEQLRHWRKMSGITLRKAAEDIGATFGSLWQYEQGRKRLPRRIWEVIKQLDEHLASEVLLLS